MGKNKSKKKNKSENLDVPQFIEDRPSFNELSKFRDELESAMSMLSALADEGDTIQRTTDLWYQIESIRKTAKSLLLVED